MADNNDFNWWNAVPIVGGVLGGLFGAQGGQPTTQTVQYLPPQYSPQQQAINNMMYYGIMQNLMQPGSPYGDLLNQYIYGTPATGAQGAQPTGTLPTAQEAIQQYEQMQQEVTEAERPMKELTRDIKTELLRPVYEAAKDAAQNKQDVTKSSAYKEAVKRAKSVLGPNTGLSAEEVNKHISAAAGKGITDVTPTDDSAYRRYARNQLQSVGAISQKKEIGGAFAPYAGIATAFQKKAVSEDITFDREIRNLAESKDFADVYKGITTPAGEEPIAPTEEAPATPAEEAPTGTITPEGGILGQIMMTPEEISKQFGLLRTGGEQDIANWYEQASRELEQRGIAQYGGLMGSQYERDIGGILGKRGEMQSTLGRELGIAESAAKTQNWYDMLNALGNLQTMQSNIQAQRISPWLSAAQSMTAVQPGYTTTQTTPGAGVFPGAAYGAYTGGALANWLGNWGQGGGTTTSPLTGQYTYRNIPQNI